MKKKNYMEEVASLLGVELEEHFKIIDGNGNTFRNEFILCEDGAAEYLEGCYELTDDFDEEDGYFKNVSILTYLLTGEYQIKKIPFKPEYNQIYWTLSVDEDGQIGSYFTYWHGASENYAHYYSGLCFISKNEADRNFDKLKTMIEKYKTNNGE